MNRSNKHMIISKIYLQILYSIFILFVALLGLTKTKVKAEEPWLWPLDSYKGITSNFGARERPTEGASTNHTGIDISANAGTPIKAAKAGYIMPRGYHKAMGNWTVIDHQDGTYSTYQHMQSFAINIQGWVTQGDIIGYVGNTGISTGAHLHFEIRMGEVGKALEFYLMTPVDPLSYQYTYSPNDKNIESSSIVNNYQYPTRDIYIASPMMRGEDVKWIQSALYSLGYRIDIDGIFGNDSKTKLMQFQIDYGLIMDGNCNQNTREKLKEILELRGFIPKDVSESDIPEQPSIPEIPEDIKIFSIEKDRYNIFLGGKQEVKVKYPSEIFDNTIFLWQSSDENIATVIGNGSVLMKSKGMAIIYCITLDGSGLTSQSSVYTKPLAVKWSLAKAGKKSVQLKWEEVFQADGYEIYMAEAKDGTYKKIKNIKGSEILSYTKKGLETNKEYYFKARAYYNINDMKVNGSWSKLQKIKPK